MYCLNICLGLLCPSLYDSGSMLESDNFEFRNKCYNMQVLIITAITFNTIQNYIIVITLFSIITTLFSILDYTCFCLPCFLRFVLDQRPSSMHSSSISTIHSSFSSLSLSFSVFFQRQISGFEARSAENF